jgi:hypothetical protein
MNATELLLAAIVGRESTPMKIEVRSPSLGSQYFLVDDIKSAAKATIKRARAGDVYVGMAPRKPHLSKRTGRQFGGSAAVERAWILSADCDTDRALDLLAAFTPPPTFIVASGSRTDGSERAKVHAHWQLREPVKRQDFESAKKRIAAALKSDKAICDAARVMRLPGSVNHKSGRVVELVEHHPDRVYVAREVLANTPELDSVRQVGPRRETPDNARSNGVLRQRQEQFSPRDYVRDLAGIEVNERGYAKCPFHDDNGPSLKCYPDASEGWFCHGACQVGGDIYTFYAKLLGIEQRELHGSTFIRVWNLLRTFYGLPVDV